MAITIISLVAFYAPIRNIPATTPAPEVSENLSALVSTPVSTSTPTSTLPKNSPSLKEMPGFSDLNQESDWLEDLGNSTSAEELNKAFEEINQ